ncbi:MAG: RluA family pseudouridine synthase [Firmicutes bacterium]|nr:RluA family pseudouridine synthase [Bacillota bacterium]
MEKQELQVVYEDNHIMVIIKPQGVLSQGDQTGDASVVDIAKDYLKAKYEKPGNVYLGMVHRLDRQTGGLMVLGKTSKATERLTEQMQNDVIEKKYLTVTVGELKEPNATLTHYLVKDEAKNEVKVYNYNIFGSKVATLNYNVLQSAGKENLVLVKLITGRSHQIRVQLKEAGTPIWGDVKYGKREKEEMALWAYKLSFIHPVSKEEMMFVSYPDIEATPWNRFDLKTKNIEYL